MIGHATRGGLLGTAIWALAAAAAAQTPAPLTCLLNPARESEIGSDRSGIVADVAVTRADFVEEGAPLVQLDTALPEADLATARIRMEGLEERIGRSERLLGSNLVSRDEISALRTELALARADAARARMEIDRATIRAPFTGYVAEIDVSVGELIGSQPLLRLIDVATLRAEMVFTDAAYGAIDSGDVLEVRIPLADATVPATVISIDPYFDASSNTFTLIAEIDNTELGIPAGTACSIAG
jgi:membrane fusion protein (multidrug efflux system)